MSSCLAALLLDLVSLSSISLGHFETSASFIIHGIVYHLTLRSVSTIVTKIPRFLTVDAMFELPPIVQMTAIWVLAFPLSE